MSIKTLGLVTRTVNYKDNDRILTLISPEYGKLSAKAGGCRKANGKLLACSQIFCYGDYMLYEKNGRCGVMSCEVRNSFFGISRDINAFSAASLIVRICEQAACENQPEPKLFALAVHALHYIESGIIPPHNMLVFALIKICDIIGCRPHFESCAVCGSSGNAVFYLDGLSGGLVCAACFSESRENPLNEYDSQLLSDVLACPNRELSRISVGERLSGNLAEAINSYLSNYFEKSLVAPKVLKTNK